MSDIGRLDVVPIREVWAHEAHNFTQWMLDNADVLSSALGVDLDLTAAEHPVGGFSLDLIGREVATDHVVIVENQLETTDHGHLGQIMTYAGGTDPQTIVWCAPRFRDEHRAALDWLNERTDEETRFFGIEISAVRIDDSRPAPLFRLVAQPNDWSKQVHSEALTGQAPRETAYAEFWTDLLAKIRAQHPSWTSSAKGPKTGWVSLPFGVSHIQYSLVFGRTGPRVEVYFGSSMAEENFAEFERYREFEQQISTEVGAIVHFDELPGRKACRIYVAQGDGWVDVLDPCQHSRTIEWFLKTLAVFRPATQRVREQLAQEME